MLLWVAKEHENVLNPEPLFSTIPSNKLSVQKPCKRKAPRRAKLRKYATFLQYCPAFVSTLTGLFYCTEQNLKSNVHLI